MPTGFKNNYQGTSFKSETNKEGRLLMKRREAAMARSEKRPEKTLRESDYLLEYLMVTELPESPQRRSRY